MASLQDLLNMRRENRMNISARPEGNSYGTEDMLSDGHFEWLRDLTKTRTGWGPF